LEIVLWPPRLIISWITPESHSCKDLCGLGEEYSMLTPKLAMR
jgi:hypothetical protein